MLFALGQNPKRKREPEFSLGFCQFEMYYKARTDSIKINRPYLEVIFVVSSAFWWEQPREEKKAEVFIASCFPLFLSNTLYLYGITQVVRHV